MKFDIYRGEMGPPKSGALIWSLSDHEIASLWRASNCQHHCWFCGGLRACAFYVVLYQLFFLCIFPLPSHWSSSVMDHLRPCIFLIRTQLSISSPQFKTLFRTKSTVFKNSSKSLISNLLSFSITFLTPLSRITHIWINAQSSVRLGWVSESFSVNNKLCESV